MTLTPTIRTDINRSAILAHLGALGPTSRAELARLLNVSPALVTQLVKQLVADGLVRELEQATSHGGRPARLLGLVSSGQHAIGVKVASNHLAFVEVGVDGSVERSATEPFDAASAMAVPILAELLGTFIRGGSGMDVLGIGVGLPGNVGQQGAGVVDSTQLRWNQVPLGSSLQHALGLPVVIDNNVNALSMAERLFGQGRTYQDFLVVTIGTGVGAGIVSGGSVMRGHGGGAGDIGHIPVAENGPACQCGNIGCLEAFIGEDALVARARAEAVIGERGNIDALGHAADEGSREAQKILGDAGHLFGRTLAGIVNTLDPEVVIVLGEAVAQWSHWSFGFEPAFRSALVPGKRGVPVSVETWQDDGWARGAAALVLATSFDTAGVSGEQGRQVRERLIAQAGRGESVTP